MLIESPCYTLPATVAVQLFPLLSQSTAPSPAAGSVLLFQMQCLEIQLCQARAVPTGPCPLN